VTKIRLFERVPLFVTYTSAESHNDPLLSAASQTTLGEDLSYDIGQPSLGTAADVMHNAMTFETVPYPLLTCVAGTEGDVRQ
jgi:hypothetical protein